MSPKIDKDTLKQMVELDLQQIAARYHQEHGVDIAVSAHMLFDDLTGGFLCGYSHDEVSSLIFNMCFMAISNLELLQEAGVPREAVMQVMHSYNSTAGEFSPLQEVLKA